MGFRVIERPTGPVEPEHDCKSQLPRRGPFWNRNPVCVDGTVIQCDRCDKRYRWGNYRHSQNGLVYKGWIEIKKIPRPPSFPAPGAKRASLTND